MCARVLLPAVSACLVFLSGAAAQNAVVRGVVVDAAGGAPVRGAFVQLLDERGAQVTAVLTLETGEFIFRLPPGTYRLRADRIGHRTGEVATFAVTDQENRSFRIPLQVLALRLPEVSVRGGTRCVAGRPEASKQTAAVWEEAKKALTVAAWVESRESAAFRYRTVTRELDSNLMETGMPRMTFQNALGKSAFRAQHPDSLARNGYVQDHSGETFLYGPDAELLLSNSFLNEHCFRLVRSQDRAGMIGLAFEPVRGRRLPDIKGTLWLDEANAELRFIEFGFTGVDVRGFEDPRFAGGRTDFRQLGNGAWIVQNWHIRAPRLRNIAGGYGVRLVGVHEEGGEVLGALVQGGSESVLVHHVAVEGTVFDSTRAQPLEGARVYLSGTPFSTVAGTAGWFRLDSVPAGDYFIAFEHPRSDSLPVYPAPQRIRIDSAGLADVRVAVPSTESLFEQICPQAEVIRFRRAAGDTLSANRGLLFGRVRTADQLGGDLEVGVSWQRFQSVVSGTLTGDLHGFSLKPHHVGVGVDAEGRYAICGLPVDHNVNITVRLNNKEVARDSMRLLPPFFLRRDYEVNRR